MPTITKNPLRGCGADVDAPFPAESADGVRQLLSACPVHRATPLVSLPALAEACGIASVHVKDERRRMGLGSFKALGAAHAIAREAAATGLDDLTRALAGRVYVTASAGNHGLSVAAGARLFGAGAVVYVAASVPEAFVMRLRAKGAQVIREGAHYEESMAAAARAAEREGWTLLSDSSWAGYSEMPYRVMEGYLQLADEAAHQLPAPPTHILLQAGVGGLAAAVAAFARGHWGDAPSIIVVEPDAAPALREAVLAGTVVETTGPVSSMGRLDCKTASLIAFKGLAHDADLFVTISEDEAARALPRLQSLGLETTPSGGAGVAALLAGLSLPPEARVWAIVSEGPEDG